MGLSKVWVGLNDGGVGEVSLSTHTHTQYAATSHTHSASQITSGILPASRGGTGYSSLSNLVKNLPVATTTSNGLMSAADKAKMSFISYNWTDAGSGNVPRQSKFGDRTGYQDISVSYNISEIYTMGIISASLVRLDFNCYWEASCVASTYSNLGNTTGRIYLYACGVLIYYDEATVSDGSKISLNKTYTTKFSYYLLPSGNNFQVYGDLSLSKVLATVSKTGLTVSARAYISGHMRPDTILMHTYVGSGTSTIHAYVIV